MFAQKAILISLAVLALAAVSVWGEPPSQYGPPGFSSPGVTRTVTSGGGPIITSGISGVSTIGSGSFFSGGESGAPEPFSYAYEVKDGNTGNDFGAIANSDGKRVQGEYRVLLPDGRRQIVKYTADDNGYNANVQYEGQARYPVTVPRTNVVNVVSGGSTVVGGGSTGSSGGTTTIVSGGSSGTSTFGGYRY